MADGQREGAEPSRAEINAGTGFIVLEFGAAWCGICRGARPLIDAALAGRREVRHLRVEDGPGRPLGRSFRVKHWPTLVFLRDGVEVARVVRPHDVDELTSALARLEATR